MGGRATETMSNGNDFPTAEARALVENICSPEERLSRVPVCYLATSPLHRAHGVQLTGLRESSR